MKSLYEKETIAQCIMRIETLQPESKALWGKMSVNQMLDHCSVGMETIRDQRHIKRVWISYLIGGLLKKFFYNEKPFKQNTPTAKEFIITNPHEFEVAQQTLINHLKAIDSEGPAKCTKHPHAFFGNLTPEQWGKGMYKHLDHHLQQFGV